MNSIASIYKKHTISVRQALLAFAAFTLLGLAFASCGKTPYEPGIYTISFAEDSGITASPNIAMKGDKIQLTIADRPGYAFGGWQIVKPVDLVIEKDNTFIMPDGEVEILPVWIKDAFSITVNSGGAPSATAGKIAATEDEVITLKHGMYPGYTFVKWDVVAPPDLIINDDYTFTMPPAKVEVTATWDAIPYTITVNDGAGGSGAAADKTTAIVTEAVQLARGTPDTGYEFDAWVVSPASVVIGADDTFAMPADNVNVTATWKKTDYTITVDPNGGTGTGASQQTANFGDSVALTQGSHEVGITFDRWEVIQPQGLVINADNTFTMPAANVVIAAKWNAVNYNITVADGVGGTGSAADKPTAIIKTTVQLTRGTEQAGYEFDKWVIFPASVFIGADDTFVMPAGDVNVTATWKKRDYAITVNQGGGSGSTVSQQTAQIGDPITLTRGTYEGYKFVRWDAVQPQGLTINNNNNTFTMPAAKVEVTAVWEAIPYTITVKDGVGGTGSTANKLTAIIKEAVQLTHGTPDTGYEFDAWVVSPAGVVIGADDTFAMPVDNVEVTATWKKTDYTITVNPSGGTGTAASQQTANYGDEIRLTRGLHEEAGITFVRWEVVQPQGLVINADDTFTMPAANVVIAAKWNAVNYNITVADGTGGSGSAADKPTAIIKTTVQLTRGTEQAGYEFDKWVISPASVFIGADDTFVMPAGDVNVTATWKKIDYTITVNQGGGSDSAASHQTAQIGDPITLTRGTYEGYKFVRWDAVQPQGLTINNNNNTFTMPAAKVEITAVWEAIPYTITVKDSVGGSGTVADKTTATIKEAVQLTRGTKQAGYEFDTWLISPASVLLGANNAFIMPAENVEVTAVWKAIDYTITVHPNGGEGTAASKTTAAHVGDTITLTRGTRTGDYDFSTWAVSPASVQVGADDTFTMPASNVEITAQWVRKPSKVEITSDHILTAQGLELTFAATVTPQDDTPPYEWSVTGNEYVSFVGNVLKVPPHAKPGTITVTASVKGYPGVKDEREITILQSTANSSGTSHTAAIRNDGTLWSSGRNNVRQLGNNSTVDSKVFVQLLGGVNTWVSVSAGYTHTAAIRSDGTLWLWGEGTYGKLGNGGTSGSHGFAAQISGGGTWVFVSAGGHHTTAIKSDGTLWLWGQNDQGQLGDESTTDRSRPLQVSGGGSWRSVSAGGSHTAAIKSDGTLWLWGLNNLGQLGDGTTTKSSVPIQLAGDGTTWASVSAGSLHTAAIKSDGTLWSWGGNVFGQLGNGLTTDSKVPVQVSGGGTWSSVSAGMYYTAGIKIDGTLWLWGWNNKGQLGDNSTTNRSRPVQVSGGGTTWISVYAGKSQHTTAMQSGGQLMVWGDNQYGQLGDNATVDRKIPARVGATWLVYPAN